VTSKDFISWVQGYYGVYPEGQKEDITEYIMKKSPRYLDGLKEALKKRYSSEFRHPPDIAVFERLAGEAIDLMPKKTVQEKPTREEEQMRADLIKEAQAKGIDTTTEGWLVKLIMENLKIRNTGGKG
jgi:hypothetical protein